MDLRHMNDHSSNSVELLMAMITFEVFRLLVIDQDFFIIELSIAIPTPRLQLLLLLLQKPPSIVSKRSDL